MKFLSTIKTTLEECMFGHRYLVIGIFLTLTLGMAWSATHIRIDASFLKRIPLQHEYMQTFTEYKGQFGGGSRILIALMAKKGDIFTADFFNTLNKVSDEVFFLPGVDRSRVKSLFTPNVRYTEVTEDGIAAGTIVPADFQPTPEALEQVKVNILKSGLLGRLVAKDFSGVLISAPLLELDPSTGERINYIKVSQDLEEKIREKYSSDAIDVHIIGFAKFIGDMTEGTKRVLLFFLVAFVITAFLVYWYSQSWKLTIVPLICSLVAVTWQLGLLPLLGFGIDPMSILVPFLIFAIGVSHGVQMIGATRSEVFRGANSIEAARRSFRRLLVPGTIALASDTIGFITILLIDIRMIQEMAIIASLGVAAIIFTNLVLLPVLLSFVKYDEAYMATTSRRAKRLTNVWEVVGRVAAPKPAVCVILIALVLFTFGAWKGADVRIGDMHRGVPELRPDSRFNLDVDIINDKFAVGIDKLSVMVQTEAEGCLDYDIMNSIDRFAWHMSNVEGVQSVSSLSKKAKIVNSGWNEGALKWRVIPRNPQSLGQSSRGTRSSSGLFNTDCSVMPVKIYTEDHKAETIKRIVSEVKAYRTKHGNEKVQFKLATGNVGIMAATNEEVEAAQFPILLYVFAAIIFLCYITYRSVRAVLCIVLPLALVALLAYAVMAIFEIGLKVSTLLVVALGVGVGVDYGIYIFSRFKGFLDEGKSIGETYHLTLEITGNGVVFTGVTLAIGVATWVFSPLKFQADMGLLLTFMFLVNMLASILVLPALSRFLLRNQVNEAVESTAKAEEQLASA